MCGILGVAGGDLPEAGGFREALDRLAQRGPDDRGHFRDDHVVLGHTRLSILDVSALGHQPMHSADGRYVIVFNGEIYNFAALRQRHLTSRPALRSGSDTEVLLELFAKLGPACVSELRGMFAFAIWDRLERSLFLARDRLGEKPLYLYRRGSNLAFASEIRALAALPNGPVNASSRALAGFLAFGHVPSPLAALEGVEPLAPASWAIYRGGELERHRYWTFPSASPLYTTQAAAIEALAPVLIEAVRLRCLADVPLGAFLSGGIDSSSVVTLMRASGQSQIRTFSLSFPGSALDEARFAARMAQELETEHASIAVGEAEMLADLEPFFAAMDQPTLDGFNTYLVSKYAKAAGLTVALSGLGGDELFGGYPSFRRAVRLAPALGVVPRALFPRLGSLLARRAARFAKLEILGRDGSSYARIYGASRGLFSADECRALLPDAELPPLAEPETAADPFNAMMQLELRRYTHDQLLADSDVFGMAHALEIRVPLLDHVLVETVARVAPQVRCTERAKQLLVAALPRPLPTLISQRPKMGFTLPFASWLRGSLGPRVQAAYRGAGLADLGIDGKAALRVYQSFLAGRSHWSRPWALYALARWQEARRR